MYGVFFTAMNVGTPTLCWVVRLLRETSCFIIVSYRFKPMLLEAGKKVGRSRVFPFACTNFIQDGLCLRLTKKLTNIDMFACYTCI